MATIAASARSLADAARRARLAHAACGALTGPLPAARRRAAGSRIIPRIDAAIASTPERTAGLGFHHPSH